MLIGLFFSFMGLFLWREMQRSISICICLIWMRVVQVPAPMLIGLFCNVNRSLFLLHRSISRSLLHVYICRCLRDRISAREQGEAPRHVSSSYEMHVSSSICRCLRDRILARWQGEAPTVFSHGQPSSSCSEAEILRSHFPRTSGGKSTRKVNIRWEKY